MDLRKGLEKLQAFQLLDKTRYALLLMVAAYLRRASRVEVETSPRDLAMQWDCEPLDREEMQSLFRLDGRLVPLGLALINAQALRPAWIRVDSGRLRLQLRHNEVRLLDLASPQAGVRFHLRERLQLRNLARRRRPEPALIEASCGGTGRTITMDGQPVPSRIDLGPCQELWLLEGPSGDSPAAQLEPRAPLRREPVELAYHAVIAVGESVPQPGLVAVAQGLRFPLAAPRVDRFLSILLLIPEHPTDLACARLQENAALVEILADLEGRLDALLLTLARERRASDPLLLGIVERLARRRQLGEWVETLTLLLEQQCRHAPDSLGETLRRASTPRPEKEAPLDRPAFQQALQEVLQRFQERRSRFLTLPELNHLVESVASLLLLRPAPELARRAAEEEALLLVAGGGLNAAATLLKQFESRDARLGLLFLCLGHPEEARPLLQSSFHQGLHAFYEGEFSRAAERFEQALEQVSGPARLVLLDHWARSLAVPGRFQEAQTVVDRALDSSTGLDRSARMAFKSALQNTRLDYPFEPTGFGQDERWVDLRERGLALSSPQDEQACRESLSMLGSAHYGEAWKFALEQLGAAHPMMRALARALADRYLQLGDHRMALTVGLIPELLALWPGAKERHVS